jgi:hypothetical protein
LEFDYARPGEKPDCRWRDKVERERMLTRVAEDAERALRAVEQAEGLLDDEAVKAAHGLLRELIGEDFDVDGGGVPRLHRGTRPDRIISTVDSEMRHGRKSSQSRFDGYKLSASATNTAEPLITAVHVAPACETDGPQAKHLIDAQSEAQRPERVLGDTAYGNGPVRAELAERDVDVLAPVPEGKIVEGRLGKHDFDIDLDADTVTCPAGHTVAISTSPTGRRRADFPRAACTACPLKAACCPGRARRQITLVEHERLLAGARRALADRDTAEHAPHAAADRAVARAAGQSLRRAQEPLHRKRQSRIAGRLGGGTGQPQPDRPPPGRTERMNRASSLNKPVSTSRTGPTTPTHLSPRARTSHARRPTSSGVF